MSQQNEQQKSGMFRGAGEQEWKDNEGNGDNRLCCNLYMNVIDKKAKTKFIQKMNMKIFSYSK